jgi:hypothetical protein
MQQTSVLDPEPEDDDAKPWGGSNEDGDGLEGQGNDPDAGPDS